MARLKRNVAPFIPTALLFHPIPQPRIWGGARLATMLHKPFPPDAKIGESWEVSGLADAVSHVRGGPYDGWLLTDLIECYPADMIGPGGAPGATFPLLIKFLEASAHLSIQVHPMPPSAGVKHEAWYIIHADAGAELFVGLRDGVKPQDVRHKVNTSAMAQVLRSHVAKAGDCYYLPSGTLHALGAGIMVAEVQTPSDVTYRLYDWDRRDASGRARPLHIEDGLRNTRYDVSMDEILQPRQAKAGADTGHTRVCTCERFTIDEVKRPIGSYGWRRSAVGPCIFMMIEGAATVRTGTESADVRRGDTILLPSAVESADFDVSAPFLALEIHACG